MNHTGFMQIVKECNCGADPRIKGGPHKKNCPMCEPEWTIQTSGPWVTAEAKFYPGRTGWICPKCQKGINPDLDTCPCCEKRVEPSNVSSYTLVRPIEFKDDAH